jgi:hypothetical protein
MKRALPVFTLAAALAAVAMGGTTSLTAAPAAKVSNYDGTWSVLIITENGECDRAYRYALRIANGSVRPQGEAAGIDISGRVQANGRVNVNIAGGQASATGSGRLARHTGSGTWRGRSSAAACSGRWEAERRGS